MPAIGVMFISLLEKVSHFSTSIYQVFFSDDECCVPWGIEPFPTRNFL
ncbi:hypothetical protein PSEUDO8O_150103 [Pseudomonas sp. 8O]|nr:hypothetical protein PSEUDO8O_150103 [Pseudomonas sp. 8O]